MIAQRRNSGNRWVARHSSIILCGILHVASISRTRGENRGDYRYEDYSEDGGRIHISTHGAYLDVSPYAWLSLKANYIYDAISGATPTGAPPFPGQTKVPKAIMDDVRDAAFIEPTFKFANHALSPQLAYSVESDYESIGVALNDAMDFNDKNTTILWGLSHSFDHVLPNEGELYHRTGDPIPSAGLRKDDSSALLGIVQLLDPNTLVTLNLTVGYSDGFLNDPYKRVLFDDFPYNPGPNPNDPFPYTVWPESRPGHKFRQVVFASVQHSFEKLHGAAELTYRFSHDSYSISAHTISAQWNQKIGKHVIFSPLFRFHTQSAAFFYGTHFPGDPTDSSSPIQIPDYYSSDYRLSALNSFTYGAQIEVKVHEHVSLAFGYKRYIMEGTDHETSRDQYPKAHVFTGGLTIWF